MSCSSGDAQLLQEAFERHNVYYDSSAPVEDDSMPKAKPNKKQGAKNCNKSCMDSSGCRAEGQLRPTGLKGSGK